MSDPGLEARARRRVVGEGGVLVPGAVVIPPALTGVALDALLPVFRRAVQSGSPLAKPLSETLAALRISALACPDDDLTVSLAKPLAQVPLDTPDGPADDDADEFVSVVEVAQRLGCSPQRVRALARAGRWGAVRRGRTWWFPAAELERGGRRDVRRGA